MIKSNKNSLGTLDIFAKFKGMRKEQEFTSYAKVPDSDKLLIQSDTRIGYINLKTGLVSLCKPKTSGAYFSDLSFLTDIETLSKDELTSINDLLKILINITSVRVI